jgi:Tat protein translocase TatB subunit
MFDIGLTEVFIILVVALFAIGPDRLPEAARALGRTMRKVRGTLAELRSALDSALAEENDPHAPQRQKPPILPQVDKDADKDADK